jgi:hypothetical protein
MLSLYLPAGFQSPTELPGIRRLAPRAPTIYKGSAHLTERRLLRYFFTSSPQR